MLATRKLEELKGRDLSHFTLEEVYYLTKWEEGNPCGRGAIICSSSELIFVLDHKLLERIKNQLPVEKTDRVEVNHIMALVGSDNHFFESRYTSWDVEDYRRILTEEEFNERLANQLNPFSWSS